MATIPKKAIQIARTLTGGPAAVLEYPEAASQSFKMGELVYLVNGKVTIFSADGTKILGIALRDASTTTDTAIPVALACDDTIFVANVDGSQTTAVTQIGLSYALNVTSTKWHIDTTDYGSNARALIVGLDSRDTAGDTAGRLHFIFLSKYRQLDTTS